MSNFKLVNLVDFQMTKTFLKNLFIDLQIGILTRETFTPFTIGAGFRISKKNWVFDLEFRLFNIGFSFDLSNIKDDDSIER